MQLTTYSTSSPNYQAAVNPDSHKVSSFIITKLNHCLNGDIIVEAEFDALFFGIESFSPLNLLEKLRFPIIMFDK